MFDTILWCKELKNRNHRFHNINKLPLYIYKKKTIGTYHLLCGLLNHINSRNKWNTLGKANIFKYIIRNRVWIILRCIGDNKNN
jgi:hypothetical protein